MEGSGSINWLKELSKSENKSRNIKRGKGLQFSSIDGWTEDKLPKLLIVWNFEKESTEQFPSQSREGKFTKPRDISATVVSYEAFLITKESQSVVPWESEIAHKDLVKIHWTKEWINKLDKETRALNEKYKGRPITFQTSFKNGKYLRLQYQVKNYSKLPKAPKEVMDVLSPRLNELLGVQFRLHKDHSANNGPVGWYDNEMGRWENIHGKDSGTLHINYGDGHWVPHPHFKEGRQDFWSGFAIDYLVSLEVPQFIDGGGHQTGMDHQLDFSSIQTTLEKHNSVDLETYEPAHTQSLDSLKSRKSTKSCHPLEKIAKGLKRFRKKIKNFL